MLMLAQFYEKENNQIIFGLYDTICQETLAASQKKEQKHFSYSKLVTTFNSIQVQLRKRNQKSYEKIAHKDAAHYCKKLEKCGFLSCQCQDKSSEKRISLRPQEYVLESKRKRQVTVDQLFNSIKNHSPGP